MVSAVVAILAMPMNAELAIDGWMLQDATKVAESGATLSQPTYQAHEWVKAVVPGTVLTSLVQAKVYPEPLYGLNNLGIPESLCRTSYWYRTSFAVPKSFGGRHVWLRFDGVNYAGQIWVNGHEVGEVKGAFARGLFDVTPFVEAGQESGIAVRILPPAHPSVPHEQSLAGGTGPNGGAMGADGPTFVATVGWDWMPGIRDRDMGLWQGIELYSTGPLTLANPYVVTKLPTRERAELTVSATVRNVARASQTGTLEGRIEGTSQRFEIPVSLTPGETREVSTQISLDKPKLWWPNGYGKQDLYKLSLNLKAGRVESDRRTTTFGVRTIEYFPKDSKTLTVIVNGVPIMCKGGNWGMDEAMKRSPRQRLEAQIRYHAEANCTMIRNWVGQSTQEEFYDLCDRYGILVWDDFWLANPADGPNPIDDDLFLANAREKLLRFRNHPSIAIWCGRNEGDPPKPLNEGLAAIVKELDPGRWYQAHSASYNGVSGYGPYGHVPIERYFRFEDWDSFHTEIGTPSIPTIEAIQAMMPRKDWWPVNDDWAYHDFTKGAQGGDRYIPMLESSFGPVKDLADFVRKSQMVNYEAHRAIFEGRNSKLFNHATGLLIWMSNPAQPSFVWQLYSYDLEPNASEFGTKKACEPIHVQMSPSGLVQVIDNLPEPLKGKVRIGVYDVGGNRIWQTVQAVQAEASAATDVMNVPFPQNWPKTVFVKLELRDSRSRLVSDNFYWHTSVDKKDDYSALTSMPTVRLDVSATRRDARHLRVELSNPGETIALMTHLQLRRGKDRVLPVYYSDNYVSLLPGEKKTVDVEADAHGDVSFVVDGWNVDVRDTGASGVPVRMNANMR